jgi:colanic acid/amylovoran biosynthesis protein
MRILVEPSDYELLNAGDLAMVTTALTRLRALWPDATIQVLTQTPELLPRRCNPTPLTAEGRWAWTAGGLLSWASRFMAFPASVTGWERRTQLLGHSVAEPAIRARMILKGIDPHHLDAFLEAIAAADLLVVCGMGGITDYFEQYAAALLETLRLAKQSGRCLVAMFSQGLGPLRHPQLRQQARAVLPQVDFIALREGRAGIPLLAELGVRAERVAVTGDDAIEVALRAAPPRLGKCFGINLRRATYAQVDDAMVERLGRRVRIAASALGARLVAVPMSRHPGEDDALTVAALMEEDEPLDGDGGGAEQLAGALQRVQSCRMIVTGSYHAAVFGLSQGVPAVCLSNSPYYDDKFFGLAEQFGTGAETVRLNSPSWDVEFDAALQRAWKTAEEVRPALLAAAETQVEAGWRAYRRVFDLVEARMRTAPPRDSRNR